MEWEEIMEEGMENTPVSWERESASLLAIREFAMESGLGLCRLQSEPWLLAWLDTRGDT